MLTRTGDPLEFNNIPQSLELLQSIQECDAKLNHCLEAFALTDMPTTLREAISVTRYFGVRYIWIDALCILYKQEGRTQRLSTTEQHSKTGSKSQASWTRSTKTLISQLLLLVLAPHSCGGLIDCASHC